MFTISEWVIFVRESYFYLSNLFHCYFFTFTNEILLESMLLLLEQKVEVCFYSYSSNARYTSLQTAKMLVSELLTNETLIHCTVHHADVLTS